MAISNTERVRTLPKIDMATLELGYTKLGSDVDLYRGARLVARNNRQTTWYVAHSLLKTMFLCDQYCGDVWPGKGFACWLCRPRREKHLANATEIMAARALAEHEETYPEDKGRFTIGSGFFINQEPVMIDGREYVNPVFGDEFRQLCIWSKVGRGQTIYVRRSSGYPGYTKRWVDISRDR